MRHRASTFLVGYVKDRRRHKSDTLKLQRDPNCWLCLNFVTLNIISRGPLTGTLDSCYSKIIFTAGVVAVDVKKDAYPYHI